MVLGFNEPVLHVGQVVLYQNNSGVECPAFVTAIYPAPAAAKGLPNEPAAVDLTVFSTNPGTTSYLANINFGSGKGTYHFIKH
jgi:hypothetical protein